MRCYELCKDGFFSDNNNPFYFLKMVCGQSPSYIGRSSLVQASVVDRYYQSIVLSLKFKNCNFRYLTNHFFGVAGRIQLPAPYRTAVTSTSTRAWSSIKAVTSTTLIAG